MSQAAEVHFQIERLCAMNADAERLLGEYYEAVGVVQRDTPKALEEIVAAADGGMWLASLGGVPVGCVVLRALPSIPFAAECKRLYVRPQARRQGVAEQLLAVMEAFAEQNGVKAIYLDSYDDLKAAIALYRKRGYEPCERYNDNPQATLFLRKQL